MSWLNSIDQSTVVALLITCSALVLAVFVEMLWPRRQPVTSITWRWSNNFGLAFTTWSVSKLASYAFILALARWTQVHSVGIFQQFDAGFWLPLASLLLVTEFIAYLSHVAFHHIPWLWPLHAVHHTDVDVDISTSYRHHPLEPLIFMPVIITVVLVMGISLEVAIAFQVITIFLTVFAHTNVRLPAWLDRMLNKIVVTPDFHRVHHSSEQDFTNSNYGVLVPWFDYAFGTAKSRDYAAHESFELGLEHSRKEADTRLDQLLLSPFIRRKRN
jgi:sterol desaturase/sphingolipid hydroxylase (fatty acid hydroxylase superfamily)